MTQMKAHGDLREVASRNVKKQLIGLFIYYAKHCGVADIVQIGGGKASYENGT